MTPSQQAKAAGLKSLKQVTEITGVSGNTLDNWSKNKPELFKTVLAGCNPTTWTAWEDEKPPAAGNYLTFWTDGSLETFPLGEVTITLDYVAVSGESLTHWAELPSPPK
jgi:hypothetical protein